MGLNIDGTQFVLYAKNLGVDYGRTITIGRQNLSLTPSELKANLTKFGFSFNEDSIRRIFPIGSKYSEELFRFLGAKDVHSVDYSDFEGATHVHDMNKAIHEELKQQYTVVLDAGTLEHIFNFPVAIKNCMEMVKVGGHYLGLTPANNFMGHGFYQFSPELFFSIFTEPNGYELEHMMAFENSPNAEWYSVKSPISVNGRVTLRNSKETYLLVIAKRISDVEPFQSEPQQSDFVSNWNRKSNLIRRYTPRSIKRVAKRLVPKQPRTGFDPKFFTPINRTARPDKAS